MIISIARLENDSLNPYGRIVNYRLQICEVDFFKPFKEVENERKDV